MPNCFQLLDRTTEEAVKFADLDIELCSHTNNLPHPVNYLAGWYDCIGLRIALGRTYDEMYQEFHEYASKPIDPNDVSSVAVQHSIREYYYFMIVLLRYINKHYKLSAWYSPR